MKKKVLSLICIVVLVVCMAAVTGCANDNDETSLQNGLDTGMSSTENPKTYNVNMAESESGSLSTGLTDTIESLRQQVVDIYATASDGTYAGSGVIVASDSEYSWVVTNHHVIDGCYAFYVDVLSIDVATGKETISSHEADLIGGSPHDDIAVLRVEEGGLPTATWVADSSKVKVGADVIAIGNPLGILGGTVTKGIISATARDVQVDGIGTMTLMQTDAAINSGNSGGGLFSTDGLLVGIVNSGYTDYEGLNFAIPANDAKFVASSIIGTYTEDDTTGKVVSYGYVAGNTDIGIEVGYWSSLVYASASTSSTRSLRASIYSVASGSDAAKQNVSAGYAILSVTYNNATYSYTGTDSTLFNNYLTQLDKVLSNIEIDTTVTLSCNNVLMGRNYYYLGSTSVTYNITAAQYIYAPPTGI